MMPDILGYEKYKSSKASSICLGTFDGYHRGHQKVAESADFMLTFHPHPKNVLELNQSVERLTMPNEQAYFFPNLLVVPFNEIISKLNAIDFLNQYIGPLAPKRIIVGYDFKFGNNGLGDVFLLKKWGKNNDCEIVEIPIQKYHDNTPFKSSIIREKLKLDPNYAFELLGHPYILSGVVVSGDKRGRKIGFPTANIALEKNKCIPKLGVYRSTTIVHGVTHRSITYIGKKPTFGQHYGQVETHILDAFSEDIYGVEMIVLVSQFLREDQLFNNQYELIEQINKDISLIH